MISAVVAGGIVLLAWVVTELVLRQGIRRFGRYRIWMPGLRLEQELHPGIHPALPVRARFEVNRDGERGSEPPRAPGTYRVLVVGSSSVECSLLDQEQAWPAVLQRRLEHPERLRALGADRVHVGNVGKSFVDASVLHQILQRLLPQYSQLDLIIMMVGGLEASRWFVLADRPDAGAQPAEWCFDVNPARVFGWPFRRSALRCVAAQLRHRWLRPVERQRDVGRWLVRARAMRAKASELRDDVVDPTPMLDAFERDLRQAIGLATRHAKRVLVLRPMWFRKTDLTPEEDARLWHGGAGWVQSQEVSTFYSHESWCRLMALLDHRVVSAAASLGIEYVDPLATIEPTLQNLYDHAHLTPDGARRLAEVVEHALLEPQRVRGTPPAALATRDASPQAASQHLLTGGTQVRA